MQQSGQALVCSKVQDAFAGSEKDVPELQPETPEKKKEGKFILFQLAEDRAFARVDLHHSTSIWICDRSGADSEWIDVSFLHAPPRASFIHFSHVAGPAGRHTANTRWEMACLLAF